MSEDTAAEDSIREQLKVFFENNPEAEYGRGPDSVRISKPWGDKTFELRIPTDPQFESVLTIFVKHLNRIFLPPRLTAIWHLDTKDLEFIFTVLSEDNVLRSRSFEFRFGSRPLRCEFAPASAEVATLALSFFPVGPPSSTNYRNLRDIDRYYQKKVKELDSTESVKEQNPIPRPTSFWIRNIDWSESEVLELVDNLSFYMTYFDRESPIVVVHSEVSGDAGSTPPRYPMGPFPEVIAGRKLDSFLLGLWRSTFGADPFLRFLHFFQVLEYAAFYYMKEETLQRLKKILTAPETPSRPSEAARQILESTVDSQMNDEQKLSSMLARLVEPKSIWSEIEPNLDAFCNEIQFEGGFTLPPLLKKGWTLGDFEKAWIPTFPDQLRWIRNAIVHSRERRVAKVITRSTQNYMKLRPWLGPIRCAAMQVMLYWESTIF